MSIIYYLCGRMLVRIYDKNPAERDIARITDVLEHDGVVVCPTGGVYAFCCSLRRPRAVARLQSLCGKSAGELSVIFADLATAAEYCRIDNAAFRLLKRNLPGQFTFILPASSRVPDKVMEKRRTVGMRIPDSNVLRAIVTTLGAPLLSASVHNSEGDDEEYVTDPSLIEERYGHEADAVVDGGLGCNIPTTVVDLTGGEPEIIREGAGELL